MYKIMQVVNKILSLEVRCMYSTYTQLICKIIKFEASDLFPLYTSIDLNWSGKKCPLLHGLKNFQLDPDCPLLGLARAYSELNRKLAKRVNLAT